MRVLVIAPHCDDEVLGAGGSIACYAESGNDVFVCIACGQELTEVGVNVRREALAAHKILGVKETNFLNLPAIQLRDIPMTTINDAVSSAVNKIKPDIVFIPFVGDIHSDHQEVAKAALVALRPPYQPSVKAVYAYETLSETEWNAPISGNLFSPNTWIDVSNSVDKKIEAMKCYRSQIKEYPHPRSLEAISNLAKYRGSTICCNYAESFMLVRQIVTVN